MRQGFTLVELSIVLVIIGLLIGGLLASQSMIQTSKTLKFIGQIQDFDIAVSNFKATYKGLPGDSSITGGPFGNDNGIIQDSLVASIRTYIHHGENKNFWPHLQMSDFKIEGIDSNLPISTTTGTAGTIIVAKGPGQNVPRMVLGENTGVAAYSVGFVSEIGDLPFNTGTMQAGERIKPANYYFIADFGKMVTNNSVNWSVDGNATRNWDESIPVAGAASVDTKIDDGNPRTGVVLNGSYTHVNSGCTANATSNTYSTGSPGGRCAMMIKIIPQH